MAYNFRQIKNSSSTTLRSMKNYFSDFNFVFSKLNKSLSIHGGRCRFLKFTLYFCGLENTNMADRKVPKKAFYFKSSYSLKNDDNNILFYFSL